MKKKLLLFALLALLLTAYAPNTAQAASNTTNQAICMAQAKAKTGKISYSWTKVTGAVRYKIYQTICSKTTFRCIKVTKATGYTATGLKAGTAYKAYVAAYDKNGKKIATSPQIHARVKGKKNLKDSNATKVKATSGLTLTVKKTGKVKAVIAAKDSTKPVLMDRHAPRMRYFSSNKSVASVNKNGLVTAKAAGTAIIYSMAPSGVYAKTKVTVKAAASVTPSTPDTTVVDSAKEVDFIRYYGDGDTSFGITLKLEEDTFKDLISSEGKALQIREDIEASATDEIAAKYGVSVEELAKILDEEIKSEFMLGYGYSVLDYQNNKNTDLTIYYKFGNAENYLAAEDSNPTYKAGADAITKEDITDAVTMEFYVVIDGEQVPIYPIDYSSQTVAYFLKNTATGAIVKKSDSIDSGMKLEIIDFAVSKQIHIAF